MARPTLQPGEDVLAQESVQLAKGFPQTAGELYLTDRRLVLDPNQLMSLGFGRPLEIQLARIRSIDKLGRFQGGTYVGGAGKKIAVGLDDGSEYTFSLFLASDIDSFHAALSKRCAQSAESTSPANDSTPEPPPLEFRRMPKPRRTWRFWLMAAATVAVVLFLIHDWIDLIRRW